MTLTGNFRARYRTAEAEVTQTKKRCDRDRCRCYLPMPCYFLGLCRKCGKQLPKELPPRPRWCQIAETGDP